MPGSTTNYIDNPVFLSDMLEPLYPFDMPLSNPYRAPGHAAPALAHARSSTR